MPRAMAIWLRCGGLTGQTRRGARLIEGAGWAYRLRKSALVGYLSDPPRLARGTGHLSRQAAALPVHNQRQMRDDARGRVGDHEVSILIATIGEVGR